MHHSSEPQLDVLVVGAGAAGVGVAVALINAGIEHFGVLERKEVGASFAGWPVETRFITPSFPTNSVGMVDINAVTPDTSPGYSLRITHPNGRLYARHLRDVALHYDLPISEHTEVKSISKLENGFRVETSRGGVLAKHVIWAAGEFQYPRLHGFEGSDLCRHTATIPSYHDLHGDDFLIIGGCESGVDAAYHLASQGKQVKLFDSGCPWESTSSEPSIALSPYSLERMRSEHFIDNVSLYAETPIVSVHQKDEVYEAVTLDGTRIKTRQMPLLAHGFEGSHKLVGDLFEARNDGYPLLNDQDESTISPGLFLCGPAVRHENHIFCFIYKYRQRFAVVAKAIANSLGLTAEGLEIYRTYGMYLDDLSCCGQECVC